MYCFHRLVEEQRVRVAEERGRDAEALTHPEGELAGALRRDVAQADHVDQVLDAAAGNAVRLREREQVVVRRPSRVHRARLEQRAHLAQGAAWSR